MKAIIIIYFIYVDIGNGYILGKNHNKFNAKQSNYQFIY